MASVFRNQAVPQLEDVATGKRGLAPVKSGVVDVELYDQRMAWLIDISQGGGRQELPGCDDFQDTAGTDNLDTIVVKFCS